MADATIVFLHGTGVRVKLPNTEQLIQDNVKDVLGLLPSQVVALNWGELTGAGAPDLAGTIPDRSSGTAGRWGALFDDPFHELAFVAAHDPETELSGTTFGAKFETLLKGLAPPSDELAKAGLDNADFTAARPELLKQGALSHAVRRAGDIHDPDLVETVATALVARMISERVRDGRPPISAFQASSRQALVEAIKAALEPSSTRSAKSILAHKLLAPFATYLGSAYRDDLMSGFGGFARDIIYYLADGKPSGEPTPGGATTRKILDTIVEHPRIPSDGPLVIVGHSLGGIIAVDLLSNPAYSAFRERVKLLVTVGSQAPVVYLCGGLTTLKPGDDWTAPHPPWINVYDPEDLLSFLAAGAFPKSGVTDVPVNTGSPFPYSHSAYFATPEFYEHLNAAVLQIRE